MFGKHLCFLLLAYQIVFNVADDAANPAAGSGTTSTTALPEGYVSFPDVHAAYKIHKERTSWNEAKTRCPNEGARLAIADSVEKIKHINSLKTSDIDWEWLHVGFQKSKTANEWVRIDNDAVVTSLPWMEDEPDGTGDCAGISWVTDKLVDYKCDWGDEFFVCEIPM